MKRELGHLGERRLGIAVIWFLPEEACDRSATIEGLSAEDRELVQSMLGMDAEVAVGHLQELGRRYQQDPKGLRVELLSMMRGDEIATKYVMEFIARIATDDQSPATGDDETEESTDGPVAQVIDFPAPKADEEEEAPGERE